MDLKYEVNIWDNNGDVYRGGNVCVPSVLLKLTVTNCSSHSTAANCEHKENKFDCSNNDDEKDLLIMRRRILLMGAKMWWWRAGNVIQNHPSISLEGIDFFDMSPICKNGRCSYLPGPWVVSEFVRYKFHCCSRTIGLGVYRIHWDNNSFFF